MIKIIAKALFQQISCQSLPGKNEEKAIIFSMTIWNLSKLVGKR